jgi:hypothetical protein
MSRRSKNSGMYGKDARGPPVQNRPVECNDGAVAIPLMPQRLEPIVMACHHVRNFATNLLSRATKK